MRKRWIALAIALSLVAAECVWFWPSGPLWRGDFRFECRALGFSPDSRELLIADGLFATAPNRPLPRLIRCDSSTGKILHAIDLPYPGPTDFMYTVVSPDASTLLVLVAGPDDLRGDPTNVYCLHDAQTGSKVAGPLSIDSILLRFSNDSRWFWARQTDKSGKRNEFNVIEALTGKAKLQLRAQNDEEPCSLCFASDSSAVAVLWNKKPRNMAASHFVQIIDLPSGKERRRLELPNRPWQGVNKWVGSRLYAEAYTGTGHYSGQTYSFDLTAHSLGDGTEEPLLTFYFDRNNDEGYWQSGSGWVAQISYGPYHKTKNEEFLDWIGKKIGRTFNEKSGRYARVRFVIPDTGRLRYELPSALKLPCLISPDGRRVASAFPDSFVEVWEADPPNRWIWSLGAAFVAAAGVLFFGRWRRRRAAPMKAMAPPPR